MSLLNYVGCWWLVVSSAKRDARGKRGLTEFRLGTIYKRTILPSYRFSTPPTRLLIFVALSATLTDTRRTARFF